MRVEELLKKLGLDEKEIRIYLLSVRMGPASIRSLASEAEINRGTVHDCLRSLRERGLVTYVHQDKHQYYIAEDPSKLEQLVVHRQQELLRIHQELSGVLPQLRSIYNQAGAKPVARFYDGMSGIKHILQDVIETCRLTTKTYDAYSSSRIKSYVYEAYKGFTEDRIAAGIFVRTISIGPGGMTVGLDERRWLSKEKSSPTYTLLYDGKVGLISVDKEQQPWGMIIEDAHVYVAQKLIFDFLWERLGDGGLSQ